MELLVFRDVQKVLFKKKSYDDEMRKIIMKNKLMDCLPIPLDAYVLTLENPTKFKRNRLKSLA